jgi:hypothetical protein
MMVKEIQVFEDANGNMHRSKSDAVRADLAIWFTATGVMNEASAKQLVDHMVAEPTRLIELRDGVLDLHRALEPTTVAAA